MAIIDDVRESYVQLLDARDYLDRGFPDNEYYNGISEGYSRAAALMKEMLNKYENDDSYLDHEPLE